MVIKNGSIAAPEKTVIDCELAAKAVEANNVCLKYGSGQNSVDIINHLNLSVPSGSIFGLIGPSGCGKTSFLRCLIGYLKPTSGDIKLFGYKPNEVGGGIPGRNLGYMPQEIALNHDLTVDEMLTYFGKLFLKDNNVLERRKLELCQLLDISKRTQLIGNLSGGQQRRVSFACSIINRPKLLILDEPTVGCDPLLRQRMWTFLERLANFDKTTIIITTHYIEETRRANFVAFMRKGEILTQNTPNYYLQKYSSCSLEEAFLKLCVEKSAILHPLQANPTVISAKVQLPYDANTYKDYIRTMYTVTERISLRLFHQKSFLYGLLIMQFLGIVMFGNFFCQVPRNLHFGFVNEEDPPVLSAIFVDELQKSNFKNIVIPKYFENCEEAVNAVKKRDIVGFIHFKPNFTDNFLSRILNDAHIDNQTIEQSTIELRFDATNKVIVTTIERVMLTNYETFVERSLIENGYEPKLAMNPISLGKPIYGKTTKDDFFSVKEFVLPQMISYLMYCYALESVIFSLIREKTELMFERNFALGVSTDQLLFGHFLTSFLMNSISALINFLCTIYLFEVPCKGSLILAFGTLLVGIALGVSTGMLFSATSLSFFLLSIFVLGYVLCTFFLGGIMWPSESLPYFMKNLRFLVPFVSPAESVRNIMVKGYDLTHPSVYWGYLTSLVMMSLLLSATRLLFHYSR